MPRNNKPKGFRRDNEDDEPIDIARLRDGIAKTVIKAGVEYTTQTTSGRNAEEAKRWICPYCSLSFGPGIAHIVVWESAFGPSKRRHFHSSCWPKFQDRLF